MTGSWFSYFQEISFKSKPNVWAYFSVKVVLNIVALPHYLSCPNNCAAIVSFQLFVVLFG